MPGNFPVSQVAGCRCTLLAGNSSISLAGSERQINVSQQSPNMREMASESFMHAFFFVVFRYFSKNFPSGAPVHVVLLSVNVISFQLRFAMAGPSYFVLLAGC